MVWVSSDSEEVGSDAANGQLPRGPSGSTLEAGTTLAVEIQKKLA
jgi:hypothetical protein